MRLRQSRLKTYYLRKKTVCKDSEGGIHPEYAFAEELSGESWPASGKIQAEQYGERLSYIYNVRLDGKYNIDSDEKGIIHYVFDNGRDIVEGDGICLFVGKEMNPDYRIISIKPYSHLRLEVERI